MPSTSKKIPSLFYSYSHKDEKARDKLSSHLALLKRGGIIKDWYDREIDPGDAFEREIRSHLESSDIILLLVSDNFIASEFCWGKEMKLALERHDRGDAQVIPVILTPLYWAPAPFGKLEALPKDGKPIALWEPRNAGWKNVAEGIAKVAEALAAGKVLRSQTSGASAIISTALIKQSTTAAKRATKTRVGLDRTIHDAAGREELPGPVVRREGDPASRDLAVNEAYDHLGVCYDFFWQTFKRKSINGKGLPLHATVHYGHEYLNAIWNGKQLVLGDGDGALFNRFTSGLDVIAKEWSKGLINMDTKLIYQGQSGALIEGISSIFACLVKQFSLGQKASEADWLIGTTLLGPKVKGVALSSLAAPGSAYDDPALGKDPQPSHMRSYVRTDDDQGGIHSNSGIPGHAFYLSSMRLGGYAWEKAGRIWYEALSDKRLKSDTDFQGFARIIISIADRVFGRTSSESKAVAHGWKEVGVAF